MLDPVVLPTLYFISVFQLILQAAVVFYAYRVTKLTGSFRAWTLIFVAFTILTISPQTSLRKICDPWAWCAWSTYRQEILML